VLHGAKGVRRSSSGLQPWSNRVTAPERSRREVAIPADNNRPARNAAQRRRQVHGIAATESVFLRQLPRVTGQRAIDPDEHHRGRSRVEIGDGLMQAESVDPSCASCRGKGRPGLRIEQLT